MGFRFSLFIWIVPHVQSDPLPLRLGKLLNVLFGQHLLGLASRAHIAHPWPLRPPRRSLASQAPELTWPELLAGTLRRPPVAVKNEACAGLILPTTRRRRYPHRPASGYGAKPEAVRYI